MGSCAGKSKPSPSDTPHAMYAQSPDCASNRKGLPPKLKPLVAAIGARAVNALAPLILVPLTLTHLGPELYGAWMAAGSVASLFLVFEFGVSSSIMTLLPPELKQKNDHQSSEIISASYLIVGLGSLVAMLMIATAWRAKVLHRAVGLPAEIATTSIDSVVAVVLMAFALTLAPQLINRLLYSNAEATRANLLQAVAVATAIPAATLAIAVGASPLVLLAVTVAAGPSLYAIASFVYFLRAPIGLVPRWSSLSLQALRKVATLGIAFVPLTLLNAMVMALDPLLVARFGNASETAAFTIPQRLFAQISALISVILLPLWPQASASLAEGEARMVLRTMRRSSTFFSMACLGLGLILVAGAPLLQAWVGASVTLNSSLMLGFAVWCATQAFMLPILMTLNAARMIRRQVGILLIYLLLAAPSKAALIQHDLISYVPVVGAGIYMVIIIPLATAAVRRALS